MVERASMVFGVGVLAVALAAGGAVGAEPVPTLALQDTGGTAQGERASASSAFDNRIAFSEGSWTVHTYGSALVADTDKGEMYTGHVGVGYFLADGISLNLEGFGGGIEAERDDDGGVGGLDLLGRWHFRRTEGYSIYIDGGAGVQQATTNFPSDSHFNFRLQFGLGGTYRIAGGAHLMGGARYLHISNAGITEGNDGYDGAQLYAGLMFPF